MSSIRSRASWGARHRDGFGNRPVRALDKWLHHSVTAHLPVSATVAQEVAQMRILEQIGQQRFGGGISYTFVLFPSGRLYQGHSIGRVGAHTGGRNSSSVGICLAGNYTSRPITPEQSATLVWLLRHGVAQGWWNVPALTGGHRDVSQTACPGNRAYSQIRAINDAATRLGSGGVTTPTAPTPDAGSGTTTTGGLTVSQYNELKGMLIELRSEIIKIKVAVGKRVDEDLTPEMIRKLIQDAEAARHHANVTKQAVGRIEAGTSVVVARLEEQGHASPDA